MLSFWFCCPVAPPTSCRIRSSVQGQLPLSVSLFISWSPGETFLGAYFSAVPSFKCDWQALPLITQAGMKTSFCFCTMSLADKPNTYVNIPHRSSLENLSHVHGLRPQYVLYPFRNLNSLWITGKGLHMNCKLWFQIWWGRRKKKRSVLWMRKNFQHRLMKSRMGKEKLRGPICGSQGSPSGAILCLTLIIVKWY